LQFRMNVDLVITEGLNMTHFPFKKDVESRGTSLGIGGFMS